ncbi:MAG TPA: ribose ABC transporter permease, partial [Agrobacterium sp.]|nr:ribose ABC transporter permease [Agrobacterium sp.]
MSLDANTGVAAKTGGFSLSAMLRSPLALPLAGLIVVSILMGLASDNFFSLNNIMNV